MIENYIGKLTEDEYRARQRGETPAIGGSGLVLIERNSPAHHVANQAKMRESKPGAFGSLVHCLALEPDTFASRYYVRPDVVERFDVPEPRQVKADAGPEPRKVAPPELAKRDALEVVLLEGYEVEKDETVGRWTFAESDVLTSGGDNVPRAWDTKREAVDAAAALNPWAFSDYDGNTMRFPDRESAEFTARAIDGGRWIAVDADAHECEACEGVGTVITEGGLDAATCWRCYGTGKVKGFAKQADAKAWAATVSGWTVDGVTFYKNKKDVPKGASDAPSGWTVDGETFYPTKKAMLEESDECNRWALAGSVEAGPWFRTRELATAHAASMGGDRIPITLADFARAQECEDALASHEVAGALLNDADATELSVLWHDVAGGVDCSGQLDVYLANTDGIDLPGLYVEPGKRVGVDLKTTARLLTPGTESSKVLDGGHHIQAAHYMDGCAANGKPLDAWIMIYVETVAPYGVRVVQLGETFLALGRYRRNLALERVREWLALGAEALPPSYRPECITVEPPARAVPDAVGEVEWADWLEAGKASTREVLLAALRVEHDDAIEDVERVEAKLDKAFAGKAELARKAVEHAKDGEYGAALAVSDALPMIEAEIATLRVEHAAAEIYVAKSYAKLQEARNV